MGCIWKVLGWSLLGAYRSFAQSLPEQRAILVLCNPPSSQWVLQRGTEDILTWVETDLGVPWSEPSRIMPMGFRISKWSLSWCRNIPSDSSRPLLPFYLVQRYISRSQYLINKDASYHVCLDNGDVHRIHLSVCNWQNNRRQAHD